MAQQLKHEEAIAYWERKSLRESWSWRDVWTSEHAAAFTVAKTAQLGVLEDLHEAVGKAIEKGTSFEKFKKEIGPVLQEKGWWGKKTVVNPDGVKEEVQLGSERRLRTIFETNKRQAYNAGHYAQGMKSTSHPYLLYLLGPSQRHREQHAAWEGVCLPKDDSFWETHHPMNGWGCKCHVRFISEEKYEEYKEKGMPKFKRLEDGRPSTERVPLQSKRPEIEYKAWLNKKTGAMEKVPVGISPGFDWNPGAYKRSAMAAQHLITTAKKTDLDISEKWISEYFEHPIVRADYVRFVRRARANETSEFSAVGLLADWAIAEFKKQGAARKKRNPKTGLVLIDAKLLSKKRAELAGDKDGKGRKHEDAEFIRDLNDAEWQALPNWLHAYDKVTWDPKNSTLIFWRELDNGWGMAAVALGDEKAVQAFSARVDHIRTAYVYNEQDWGKLMEHRKKRDVLVREK